MLTQLKIQNFRLFKHLHIEDLRRINLFAGKNNSGKTALLEALRIMAAGEDLSVMEYILQQRGQHATKYHEAYDPLFYRPILQGMHNGTPNIIVNDFGLERIVDGSNGPRYNIILHGNRQDINLLRNR